MPQASLFCTIMVSNWQWFVYNVRRLEGNWAKQVIFLRQSTENRNYLFKQLQQNQMFRWGRKNSRVKCSSCLNPIYCLVTSDVGFILFPRFYGPIHFRISQFTSISCIAKVMMNSCEKGHQKKCWQNSCQFGLKSHNKKVSQEWRKH